MYQTLLERIQKIFAYARAHKIISAIVLAVALYFGYSEYKSLTSTAGETRYVLGTVRKGAIIVSTTGSGQVATSNQLDLKPKVSGDVTWVGVKAGSVVYSGQALAQIDDTTAKQAVADAEQSLTQAKLQFQKDTAQAPIDYQKLLETLATAKTDLSNTYNDTYNTVSNTYLDLPLIVTGMQNILYGYDLSPNKTEMNVSKFRSQFNISDPNLVFADVAERDYKIGRDKYDQAILDYKQLTRYSSTDAIEKELTSSIDTSTAVAQAIQSELNILDAVVENSTANGFTISPAINTMRTNARNYLSSANSDLSAMLNQQKTLDNTKNTIRDTERSIQIYNIGNPIGDNPISLQSSQYSITDQERKLQQLKDGLADYTIKAPFSGTVSAFNIKQFDSVSTGTTVATLITSQKIAQLSFNELDAAKVKLGQKATLTFDAIDGLSIAGSVIDMDTVGTVSQGVVTYAVKIGFDTQDDRVKPGMSVSTAIIISMKQDVLAVPNSALKTSGGTSYVELFDTPLVASATSTVSAGAGAGLPSAVPPRQQAVVIGLSNDSETEIVSGLTEGEQIVTRTIAATTATTAQAPSLLNAAGVRTGGTAGGATRAVTGGATRGN